MLVSATDEGDRATHPPCIVLRRDTRLEPLRDALRDPFLERLAISIIRREKWATPLFLCVSPLRKPFT
jgi:hypothetical protein